MERNRLINQFFRYTGLNILGMMGFAFYVFADTYYVAAGMGVEGLSALNQAIPIYNFMFGICLMVAIGGGIRLSMCRSLGDQSGAAGVVSQTLMLGLGFVVLFELLALFGMPWVMDIMGVDGGVYQWSLQYSQIILFFSPMFMFNQIAVVGVRNEGHPRLAMIAMVAGSLFNVVADYVFIFIFDWGMMGAALATGTSPLVGLVILLPYLLSKQCALGCRGGRPNLHAQMDICQLGGGSLVMELSGGIVLVLFNNLMLAQGGNPAVAAYGVIANLAIVIMAIYTGIAQGIQPLCSSFAALKQQWELGFVLRLALGLALIISLCVYLGLVLLDGPLVAIFNEQGNVQLQEMAEYGVRRYFLCLFFAGTNIVLAAFFSATAHPRASFLISIARGGVLLIPVALMMATRFGLDGIWLSLPVTEAITALLAVALLASKEKSRLHTGCSCNRDENALH